MAVAAALIIVGPAIEHGAHAWFARLYPSAVTWADRRPIGMIVLATANAGLRDNPRGWFLDRSLNVFSRAGAANFHAELMAYADRSIAILRQMNAQGAVTWDIEGEQYPHPSTYVGDPRLIEILAPEMAQCIDEYFKRFRDAGLRVGLTIRPQQFVRSTDARVATQQAATDPAQVLNDKIGYARARWGATLFYVDSNTFLDAGVFRSVSARNPGILLIPEHSTWMHYGVSAPYGELRNGVVRTPFMACQLYRNAFRVINVSDGPIARRLPEIRASVKRGDILMFRAWFDDPANAIVNSVTRGKVSLKTR